MNAVVFDGIGDIRLDDVGDPESKDSRAIDPTEVVTQMEPLADAIEACRSFDKREPGWLKVELELGVQ